jgi:hypothetical protein
MRWQVHRGDILDVAADVGRWNFIQDAGDMDFTSRAVVVVACAVCVYHEDAEARRLHEGLLRAGEPITKRA